MAREFPRFLFSNPKNTKTTGPFIIHMLDPHLLFRVEWGTRVNSFKLIIVPKFGFAPYELIGEIELATRSWLQAQLDQNEVIWGS